MEGLTGRFSKIRQQHDLKEKELEKQIEKVRKTAELETERFQRRAEAEKADLKATVSRLEVDLMKVSYLIWFPEGNGALIGITGK